MLIVKVKKGNIERALKEYKYKVHKTNQIQRIRDNQEYTKDSVTRREEKKKAIYVNKKRDSE